MESLHDVFFLKADLRAYWEEKDQGVRSDRANAIFDTYFSGQIAMSQLPMDLVEMITEYKQCNQDSPTIREPGEVLHQLQLQLTQHIETKFDFVSIIRGSVTAAVYQKRSGGKGDLPDEVFHLLRHDMNPAHGAWKLRLDKICQVYTSIGNGTFTVLETVVADVPVQLAIDFQQYQHADAADRMNVYKRCDILEEIGPMCQINYLLLKKAFFLMKRMDTVLFQCAKLMDDGVFVNLHTSVEHPKAPINDPKKIKRVEVIYGGTMFTPISANQTRITFITMINASKFLSLVISSVSSGRQVLRMKQLMENVLLTTQSQNPSNTKMEMLPAQSST
eukprot:TRINITY_DN5184_c0_g1_i1.p1 TRINITY_DN5184_c0_g1~~TRINITY_DN5184_c0_g1_i1.p1  ORF type:complete len:333 (+),score=61.62 TRINITY_DN5184_c0_g1_i1:98-1096(+)